MEIGPFYYANQKKWAALTDADWKAALAVCTEHLKWRLKQKTYSGAHSQTNLGADPIAHYLGLAYEKIINGEWEWKDKRSLSEQMIRVVDSSLSKAVEKVKTNKTKSLTITYKDDADIEFYSIADDSDLSSQELEDYKSKVKSIEASVKGDSDLEFFWEAIKEGKRRDEIADLLEKEPKQVDKLREKLIRRVKEYQTKGK